jgi:hypothetical protein
MDGARHGSPDRDHQTARGGAPAAAGKPDDEGPSQRQRKQQKQRGHEHAISSGLSRMHDDRAKVLHGMDDDLWHGVVFF